MFLKIFLNPDERLHSFIFHAKIFICVHANAGTKETSVLTQNNYFIPIKLSARTFKNFARFNAFRRQHRWIFPVSIAVFCFIFSVLSFMFQEKLPWGSSLGSILSAVTVLVPLGYFRSFYSALDTQVERMNLKEPRHVYTIELSESNTNSICLFYPGEKYPSEIFSWKTLEGAWRTDHAIYIYINPQHALLIPDVIKTLNQDELWKFLGKHLGTAKIHNCQKRGLLF